MNISIDTLEFKTYDANNYTSLKECPKCHSPVSVSLMDGCTHSKEMHCRNCGKVIYLFAREVSVPTLNKSINKSGPKKVYTIKCQCHRILGGPECKFTFDTKAKNALYHPEHSENAKNTRSREMHRLLMAKRRKK